MKEANMTAELPHYMDEELVAKLELFKSESSILEAAGAQIFESHPDAYQAYVFAAAGDVTAGGVNHAWFLAKTGDDGHMENIAKIVQVLAYLEDTEGVERKFTFITPDQTDEKIVEQYEDARPEATKNERMAKLDTERTTILHNLEENFEQTIKTVLGEDRGQQFIDDERIKVIQIPAQDFDFHKGFTIATDDEGNEIASVRRLTPRTEGTDRPWEVLHSKGGVYKEAAAREIFGNDPGRNFDETVAALEAFKEVAASVREDMAVDKAAKVFDEIKASSEQGYSTDEPIGDDLGTQGSKSNDRGGRG